MKNVVVSGVSLLAGLVAGAINGFFIAFLACNPSSRPMRQASFMLDLPVCLTESRRRDPADVSDIYRTITPFGIPLAFYIIVVILLVWWYIRSTRYGRYLYAVGGKQRLLIKLPFPSGVII